MLEVEAMQLLRLLEVQYVSSYTGIDPVETQLRKKAFWLMFYSYIHHVHSYRHERITFLDPLILQKIKLEELMPVPVDDEYITKDGILPCPESLASKSLTSGFNIHSRVFLSAQPPNPLCSCPGVNNPTTRITKLKDQVRQLKYMLDTVQPTYRPWNKLKSTHTSASDDDSVEDIQREIIRANIQTTYLWLQIVLLDQIDTIGSEQKGSSGMSQTPESVWDERENVCRELLHTMHSFSYSALEPNGNALVSHSYSIDTISRILSKTPFSTLHRSTSSVTLQSHFLHARLNSMKNEHVACANISPNSLSFCRYWTSVRWSTHSAFRAGSTRVGIKTCFHLQRKGDMQ
jgi:hypothetical protein